uniref:Tripartite motif containing 65 n=1 Tax=Tetraodon nigroviridis TaxID=99883 RepID=H3DA24_TETNG
WSEEETFACPVCLETLKEPATLPCGHSYCLVCIQSHWDKKDNNGQYSCPQCRQVFQPRPSLAKSTVLVEAMEKLRANSVKHQSSSAVPPSMPMYLEVLPGAGPRRGNVYPQLPTLEPRSCPQHDHPLDLFCREDKECVCKECCQHGHKGHHVVKPQEEREERQEELVQMQADVQKRIQETKRKLSEIPHFAGQHKVTVAISCQALQQESTDAFAELVRNVNLTGTQVSELLSNHEASLGSQVEGHINSLQQEVEQLRWRSTDLSTMAAIKDPVCFLKNFLTMEPLCQRAGESWPPEEAVVASIRAAIKELQESVQNLCKTSLEKITTLFTEDDESFKSSPPASIQAHPATSVSTNPEPKTREEMLKFRFEPTMDPNTAYRHLQLSDGGRKATLKAENLNPPDHPERFSFWRQVLCREPLGGSPYYWEVEWTGHKITIGVAHKGMQRKTSDDLSRLGHNALSWSVYWSGTGFSFWHNGQEKLLGSPKARRIGVYLDQHAGVLSFYRISSDQAQLI